jgi:acyl-CoA synthetase (AMP-forming)/AMP-acid ligase II
MPNFAYDFLATRVRKSQLGDARLDTMRAWINCSEPTFAQSHRRFLERFAPLGVRAETLWTCYAAAETTFAISQSSAAISGARRAPRARALPRGGEANPTHGRRHTRDRAPVRRPAAPRHDRLDRGRRRQRARRAPRR